MGHNKDNSLRWGAMEATRWWPISVGKYIYIPLFFVVPHTQGAQARITQFYLHQCLPVPRKHSPDGASPD